MRRILVIEDETNLRNTLVDLLEINNYDVITAKDGEDGMRKVIETTPDVVLCDVNMPKMNGFEVLEMLSNTLDEIQLPPFIFLTAKTDRESSRFGMSLGAEDYITKPFNNNEVLKAIELRIQKRDKIQQLTLNSERTRISGELHNGIQNIIVAAGMGIKSIVDDNTIENEKLTIIKQSSELIDMAISETRNLSHNLRPNELENQGLEKYIKKVTSTLVIENNIDFDFHSTLEPLEDKKLQLNLCRLIQEMITNTLKHAKANKIELSINEKEKEITIDYKDNGIGFDMDKVEKTLGLKNLKQQAKELKGKLQIESFPKKGITIYFNLTK